MDVDDTQFETLRAAADEGTVARDGFRVAREAEGYAVSLPHGSHAGLDAEGLRRVAAENADFVTNWHYWSLDRPDDHRAFLRHLEGADEHPVPERYDALRDGVAATWGQLRVEVTLDDDRPGTRRYDLRHEDDAGTPLDALDRHEDPLDARRIAKHDDRGRYRPLKTAPSLRTGWAFPDLSGQELARAVDFLYPATVANWYREREGRLDVSHWRETAERQTGIYDVIDELDVEAVEWIAEACCVDSQCLKRREWDEDEDVALDVPRGDGAFPCREPCSLVVAAARKWTTLEREEPREYTFELTPSEREQVEEVIDAVAEGRVGEIREADVYDGANRYRARFLRAKRFEDGSLPAVGDGTDGHGDEHAEDGHGDEEDDDHDGNGDAA